MTALFTLISSNAMAWDCDSNCDKYIKSKFWWKRDYATRAMCLTDKAASCKFWNGAVDFFAAKVKPMIKSEYNREKYEEAKYSGEEAQYMSLCTGAATASLAVIGTSYGGPWGAVIGGAGGAFVSYQICKQSTKW